MGFLAVLGALASLGKSAEEQTNSSVQDGTVARHSARSNLVWPGQPSNPYQTF